MSKAKAGLALMRALKEEPSVSVELAGRALGIRRSSAYAAIRSGELPHIKIGRRIAVPTAWLRAQLQMSEQAA
jgi:Helix-turn-helix domain